MGYPSTGAPQFDGRCLNALSRKVETPYPGDGPYAVTSDERRRVEEFIGCTLEQSYSEFTVELKNAVHRLLDDINNADYSRPARKRGRGNRRKESRARFT